MEIILKSGEVALVDDADYAGASQHQWYLHPNGYAQAKIAGRMVLLHHFVMGAGRFDHKNRNKLDCHRDNLRPCTKSQNAANMNAKPGRFKGISFNKEKERYEARIKVHGRSLFLGYFGDPEPAARAYDAAAQNYFGQFACLNFPMEVSPST